MNIIKADKDAFPDSPAIIRSPFDFNMFFLKMLDSAPGSWRIFQVQGRENHVREQEKTDEGAVPERVGK